MERLYLVLRVGGHSGCGQQEVKFDMENEGDGGERRKSFLVEALLCIIERDHRVIKYSSLASGYPVWRQLEQTELGKVGGGLTWRALKKPEGSWWSQGWRAENPGQGASCRLSQGTGWSEAVSSSLLDVYVCLTSPGLPCVAQTVKNLPVRGETQV